MKSGTEHEIRERVWTVELYWISQLGIKEVGKVERLTRKPSHVVPGHASDEEMVELALSQFVLVGETLNIFHALNRYRFESVKRKRRFSSPPVPSTWRWQLAIDDTLSS